MRVASSRVQLFAGISLAVIGSLPPSAFKMVFLGSLGGLAPLLSICSELSWMELASLAPCASFAIVCLLSPLALRAHAVGYLGWMLAAISLGLAFRGRARESRREVGGDLRIHWGTGDLASILAVLALSVPLHLVFSSNGRDAAGRYVAHAWFSRDSYFLFAFAQMSLEQLRIPVENPFLAGAGNHYAGLLHSGLGVICAQSGQAVAFAACTYAPLLFTAIPGVVLFSAIRRGAGGSSAPWLALLALPIAYLVRLDLFTYPQSQSLAYSILVLLFWTESGREAALARKALSMVLTAILVLGHTVTAPAALAYLFLCRLWDAALSWQLVRTWRATRRWPRSRAVRNEVSAQPKLQSVLFLLGILALAALYGKRSALPFHGVQHMLDADTVRAGVAAYGQSLFPSIVAIVVGSILFPWTATGALPLLALGGAYRVFAQAQLEQAHRYFAEANCDRFAILGLVALAALLPATRSFRLACALVALWWAAWTSEPRLAQMAVLFSGSPATLSLADLEFFERVRVVTDPKARILSLSGDYALPAFTGRAQACFDGTLWGLGTISTQELEARCNEVSSYPSQGPEWRRLVMEARGYTHVLYRVASLPVDEAAFADAELGKGRARVSVAHGSYVLLSMQ